MVWLLGSQLFCDGLSRPQDILQNNYVRGAVSGLGIVNLLLGFEELASVLWARRTMQTMETIKQS